MSLFQSYDHEMRGRPDRCDICGGPLLLGVRVRCIPCRVFPERANRVPDRAAFFFTYPDLPPLQRPEDRQDDNLSSLREEAEKVVWSLTEGDKPQFPPDPRCFVCCLILTEYSNGVAPVRPTQRGYLCGAHFNPPVELVGWEVFE